MSDLIDLRRLEFDARQLVRELRRAVYDANLLDKIDALATAEGELQRLSNLRSAAEVAAGIGHGNIVSVQPQSNLLGPQTTGLEVSVQLHMATIPTALVHLFDAANHPLVRFDIRNTKPQTKRLRVISYVEGYSAQALDTIEVEQNYPIAVNQLPTFFPERLATVTEVTRASLNVEVQDLDAKTELHKTVPVWLLARTTAPLKVQDPATGNWLDMTDYLGAFVTPNAPDIMMYLKNATDKQPQKRFIGYQGDEEEVTTAVKAIFESLAASGIKYVNSIIDFTPETGTSNQRVRLPRESITNASANCIDGTVLIASLLEAVSLNPAIVIVPGHAFLGWETGRNSDTWQYLETTMIATHSFDEACTRGLTLANKWLANTDKTLFKRLSLRELRARGITPLE
jgi:hypothetical protein